MYKNIFKDYIYPIAVFSGGMIGVGFLSLPYIAMKTGIWLMLLYFIVLTAIVITINLIFCQISLKTPDYKRFPGFAKYHLGKWGGIGALVCTIAGTIGAMLVFLIVGGKFLSNILSPLIGGPPVLYTIIYFVAASTIVFFGIKIISRAELWILTFLFLSLLLVFVEGFSNIKISNIFTIDSGFKISSLLLPYGPILFALWGVGLIPEVEEMIVGKKKLLKRIVTIATIIVSVLYFLFIILILGLTGAQTTETALTGLKGVLDGGLIAIALLAGLTATFTAFIMQGIILKKVFMYDLGIKHWQAFIMTCFTPLILLMLGFNSFINVISFFGGGLFGVFGIMILLM